METRVLTVADSGSEAEAIGLAARALSEGALVVFPTETVYGIGASAVHAGAIEALSRLKNRTPDKPFTLHLADAAEVERYAGPVPALARRLIHKTWPGPLTLVLPDRRPERGQPPGLVEEAVYWQGHVGMRCPRSALTRAVLREAGVPVVGSSANLAGRPAPYRAAEALADLGGQVALVLDAGPTFYGRASTVVRVGADETYEVIREGVITARRLERLIRTHILLVCTGNLCRSPMAVGLAARMLADRLGCRPDELAERGIEIESAGTGAAAGLEATASAATVMAERGIDIHGHRSQPITVDALLASDYIWVMARSHREAVVRLAPEVAARVALVDPSGADIADPIGGDLDAYRACARHIEQAVAARILEII
jgi:tRNA threonylcarbamoyl adenosine modification protein (Sua5/YciO/YrdC/YwlC family)